MPFDIFGQVRPPEMAEIGQNFRNKRFFETCAFQGCFFVTDGRRDLGIGSYERSSPVDVPFDSHWKWPKFAKMSKNSGFFLNMGINEIVNTPWNRGAVGAFSCFTNTSLYLNVFLVDKKIYVY